MITYIDFIRNREKKKIMEINFYKRSYQCSEKKLYIKIILLISFLIIYILDKFISFLFIWISILFLLIMVFPALPILVFTERNEEK